MRVPLYRYSFREAKDHDEVQDWKQSHAENIRCREAIDKMVSERYRNNHMPDSIVKDACADFGIDRVGWVLATTVSENSNDGRYRPDTRKYLSEDLGILSKEACLTGSNAEDYTDKLLILHSDALTDEYKKGEFQYFYANGGNGCRPTSLGRKIFGFFVTDGEKTHFNRADFIGIADPEQVPDWVSEKLDSILQGQANTEDGGMQLQ